MNRIRRTMLFVPGNNPSMINDPHIYKPDSIIFDLEDSVSLKEKDAARFLVYNALKSIDYGQTERVVRINALNTPYGREDLEAIVRAAPDAIRLPKAESADDLCTADQIISEIESKAGLAEGSVKLIAAIETALGVINAYKIASAGQRVTAVALGAEDFITDMKSERTNSGFELHVARIQILMAARAAKIDALDTVFSDVADEDGFKQEVMYIKKLGFDGKSVIHPRQIEMVHSIFTPTVEEVSYAKRVIEAAVEAETSGSGVIALDGKMIDKPIVERAYRVIGLAKEVRALA